MNDFIAYERPVKRFEAENEEMFLTIASCRPIFPTVTPPEKNIQGSHERTYKKSGDVYLRSNKRIKH